MLHEEETWCRTSSGEQQCYMEKKRGVELARESSNATWRRNVRCRTSSGEQQCYMKKKRGVELARESSNATWRRNVV